MDRSVGAGGQFPTDVALAVGFGDCRLGELDRVSLSNGVISRCRAGLMNANKYDAPACLPGGLPRSTRRVENGPSVFGLSAGGRVDHVRAMASVRCSVRVNPIFPLHPQGRRL